MGDIWKWGSTVRNGAAPASRNWSVHQANPKGERADRAHDACTCVICPKCGTEVGCSPQRWVLGSVLLPGSRGKVWGESSSKLILMGHYAALKKLHVPLSNLHEPGHLEDLVPIVFSCLMPRNTVQHGASKHSTARQQHLARAFHPELGDPSLCHLL